VAQPIVVAEHVRKDFGSLEVLKDISLEVSPGEVVFIMGPSGSGKSTLLRCLNHLETIDGGRILIDGDYVGYREERGRLHELRAREVARRRAEIGMVFQRFNLFPHLTVLENVIEAPMRVRGLSRREAVERAEALLARVGLAEKAPSYPRQLSGGQQQRVAIARAMAMEPKLMLFDEPTSALDPELVGEVLSVIQDLATSGMTMIVVTHELGFARQCATRLIFMDGGHVLEDGAPDDVITNPTHPRTRAFVSQVL
jgi:polar amino acid transport system ATP-binding protein